MNLTWHIFKKDLRALKWPLLLWTLLIAAKLGVGVLMLRTSGADVEQINSLMHLQVFAYLLAGLECVSFVLAAALIQEDLLVGTSAFWVTRPISGARLLRAKLLGLVLIFGLLPLLVTLPWWLWNGYGLREISWAALETLLIHAACVLLGLLWSVVTDGFARFLMWTLVMLVAIPSVTATVGLYVSGQHPQPSPGVMLTRTCVEVAFAVAGILTLAGHQFLTRKTWRSVVVIGATIGLIIATALWWPWNLDPDGRWNRYMTERAARNADQVAEPAGLTYALESAQLSPPPAAHPERPSRVLLRFTVKGLPANLSLRAGLATYSMSWPDGSSGSRSVWLSSGFMPKMAARAMLGGSAKAEEGLERFSGTLIVLPELASRLQREPPAFTMNANLWILQFESMTKVLPEPGSRSRDGAATERIAGVETEGNVQMVTTVRTRPDYWINDVIGYLEALGSMYSQCLLVNRERGEVSYGHHEWGLQVRIASVSIEIEKTGYSAPTSPVTNKPSRADFLRQAEWMQHAELMRENFPRRGRFTHTLQVDALRLDEAKP